MVRGALEDVLLAWACVRSGIVFCPSIPPSGNQTQRTGEPARARAFWSAGEIPAGDWQALSLDFTGELAADGESRWYPTSPT